MKQSQSPPPQQLRPWYYQNWVLFPAFVVGWPLHPVSFLLWPLWAVLILRSPWHKGILSGSLAWAMLFSGGVLVVLRLAESQEAALGILALTFPGLLFTMVTQSLWIRHKRELTYVGSGPTPSSQLEAAPMDGETSRLQREGLWRRGRRRRGSRPGRYSRHPH